MIQAYPTHQRAHWQIFGMQVNVHQQRIGVGQPGFQRRQIALGDEIGGCFGAGMNGKMDVGLRRGDGNFGLDALEMHRFRSIAGPEGNVAMLDFDQATERLKQSLQAAGLHGRCAGEDMIQIIAAVGIFVQRQLRVVDMGGAHRIVAPEIVPKSQAGIDFATLKNAFAIGIVQRQAFDFNAAEPAQTPLFAIDSAIEFFVDLFQDKGAAAFGAGPDGQEEKDDQYND